MQPVFLMIGGVMTGLAIGRRAFTLLLIGVLAIVIGWFNPDAPSGLPIPVVLVAILAGFILSRAFPSRRRRRHRYGISSSDPYTASTWSDSGTNGDSGSSGWFGGGASGGGGASTDWGGDSGGSDSGGGDSGGGDSGGGSSD